MGGTSLFSELSLLEPEGTSLLNENAEALGHPTDLPKLMQPEFKPWRVL